MKIFIIILISIVSNAHSQPCRIDPKKTISISNNNLIDNGDGTVLDKKTGLLWQKCQLGLSGENCIQNSDLTYNWDQAVKQADESSLASYSWRLPTFKELNSIVIKHCNNRDIPFINNAFFPNTTRTTFWTSTVSKHKYDAVATALVAYYISFKHGYPYDGYKGNKHSVRLVRSIK